jgi:uncharacterized protein
MTESKQIESGTEKALAVITGASSGIGYELAKCCASAGYDLLVAADDGDIGDAAESLKRLGVDVRAVQVDLATKEGVDEFYAAAGGREIAILCANAGHGLGRNFLDQDFDAVRHVIDTNITGTVYLLQKVGVEMRARRAGRILITGSIAGFMPGSFQAAYNGTKAFIDSFALALREELKDSGVTVTCLMPGATDTRFFERADMLDTKVGTEKKESPADVAKTGFEALMKGEAEVVAGVKNKLQAAMAHITPDTVLAGMHRNMAEPGTAEKRP